MKSKIKYKMFLSRKKFNVINWIKNTKNANYELFCSFLESRNVIAPGLEYFNKALDFYSKNVIVKEKEVKVVEPVKEVKVVEPVKEVKVVEPVKEVKVVEEVKEEKSIAQKIVQLKELVEKKESATEEVKVEEPPVKKTRRRRRTKKS